MTRPPDYRIIYNWDGAPHGFSEVPQSMDAFLDKVYAPMANTQVGAHFWCVGEDTARWESEVMEMEGERHGRVYESAGSYVNSENIRQMLDRGEDPQEGVVRRGHELGLHVYASVRMNDNHMDGAQPSDLATMRHSEVTALRAAHPEWVLGDRTSEWFAASWNFEIPEVREYRLAHIREVCTRYDWDGVEVDWQRHAFHLPKDYAYRLRYVLTDVQRAVRLMADEMAAERGRPFYVAARVAPTLEMNRLIGYDVPTWLDEGLVDILIPAGGYATDPSMDVRGYVDLCRGTDVAVYPGLDVWLETIPSGEHAGTRYFVGPEDIVTKEKMRNRAVASASHAAGAAGMYIFNWYADGDSRRELLSEIGSAYTLRRKDKVYAATHRFLRNDGPWRGALDNDRIYGEVDVPLKRTITGEGPTISLDVADDLEADRPECVTLRVRLDQWVKGDAVSVLWDGVERTDIEVRYDIDDSNAANPFGARVYDVSSAVWLTADLDPTEVQSGRHDVKVVLVERHPQLANDIILTDVELLIRYSPGD